MRNASEPSSSWFETGYQSAKSWIVNLDGIPPLPPGPPENSACRETFRYLPPNQPPMGVEIVGRPLGRAMRRAIGRLGAKAGAGPVDGVLCIFIPSTLQRRRRSMFRSGR